MRNASSCRSTGTFHYLLELWLLNYLFRIRL
jgi:hypothetical protein